MKRNLWLWCVGTCVALMSPLLADAQTAPTTTPSTTTPSSTAIPSTSINNQGGGGSGNLNSSFIQPQQATAIKIPNVTASGGGGAAAVPNTNNPLAGTYVNPLSYGLPSKFTPQTITGIPTGQSIGTPLYVTTTQTTPGGGGATTQQNQQVGFSTYGTPRGPAYQTVPADDLPLIAHRMDEVQARVQAMLDRSSAYRNKGPIQVTMNGPVVQLHGQLATEKERRVVEGLVRTAPGVREVQNLIVVPTK